MSRGRVENMKQIPGIPTWRKASLLQVLFDDLSGLFGLFLQVQIVLTDTET